MSFRVFIPFIHDSFSKENVQSYLEICGLCKVLSIDLHEKKEKTSNGSLRSLNHYYAFLEVIPNIKTQKGKLFQENLEKNYHTKVIHDEDYSKYWTLKAHLSVSDRNERGISLLPTTTTEIDEIVYEKSMKPIETENKNDVYYTSPEWIDSDDDKNIDLSQLSPIEYHSDLPECLAFVNESIMKEVANVAAQRKSYFQSQQEKYELECDYHSIETDLKNMHRLMQMIL